MFRTLLFSFLIFNSTSLFGLRPYIIYHGHQCGLFSSFLMVIGMLDGYDREEFAGVEVAPDKSELYFEKAYGSNWWEYYFSPICTKMPDDARRVLLDEKLFQQIALLGHQTLSRKRCHELICKYIRIKPEIMKEVDFFLKKHLQGEKLIGIHYRGTDKFTSSEANRISPQEVCMKVKEYLRTFPTTKVKIFVATDSEVFLVEMKKTFGKKVIFFNMKRSQDSAPLHTDQTVGGYMKGKMALLDCLVLSKCDVLMRTSSNLSNASMLFNPTLPVIRLNNATQGTWALDR